MAIFKRGLNDSLRSFVDQSPTEYKTLDKLVRALTQYESRTKSVPRASTSAPRLAASVAESPERSRGDVAAESRLLYSEAVTTVANPWEALVDDEDDRYFAAVMRQTPAEGQRYFKRVADLNRTSVKQTILRAREKRGLCYICQRAGHYAKDCSARAESSASASAPIAFEAVGRECCLCGRAGHVGRDCPL